MLTTVCPPPADLQRLILGGVPSAEADQLEQHVLHCGSCLERLKGLLPAQDLLTDALAGAGSAATQPTVVEELMSKLAALRSLALVPAPGAAMIAPDAKPPTTSEADATQAGLAPDPDNSLTDFLAPPQNGDELGRLGRYRVLKVLGRGGMGVVFQAEDPELKRSVALKAMLPALAASASGAAQRFRREAQAMAAVEHDHIVRIYQVDTDRGVPFLAMEFLKGEPLDERLQRDGLLPVEEALRIGREIAEGLAAAHATGLIHRDVKPGNVWLEAPRGRVKILDFGLARAASQDAGLTQEGAIIGTPAYMAPEQGGAPTIDARCDLFSLGVVMYRMCCGRLPFQGRDAVSTLMSIAMDEPVPPRLANADLPVELSDLVMRLLEKDPDRRPAAASDVANVLHAIETSPAGQPRPATAPRRRRGPLVAAAAVLLLGAIGVGLWGAGLIRFGNDQGEFVMDTQDEDFAMARGKDGGIVLTDRKTKRKYNVKALLRGRDEYELEVTDADADLSFKTKTLTIKRGETVALKAWFERKKDAPALADDAFIKEVAALPAAQQAEAVGARLKERNPGFDGQLTPRIEDGVVVELNLESDVVTDLSPVLALPGLSALHCGGTAPRAKLQSLAPLKDMKLTTLVCAKTLVSDLTPLEDMKLRTLVCSNTLVSDLTPLKSMPLKNLNFSGSKVSDLTPLQGMPLEILGCANTPVSDLTPLKDMKLKTLYIGSTRVADMSLLKGMPLQAINIDFKPERDAVVLRAIQTLRTINDKPAAEFWKGVDQMKP